jgi:hypothetical protein
MRNLEDYRDQYGMFFNIKDGGCSDSLQRLGMYYFVRQMLRKNGFGVDRPMGMDSAKYHVTFQQCEVAPHVFIRHPVSDTNPHNVTRDQITPNILALGALNVDLELKYLQLAIKDRYYFYQNVERNGLGETCRYKLPDFQGPEFRASYERFFPITGYKKIFLYLSDLWFLIGTIWRIKQTRTTEIDDCSDDINLILMLIQAQEYQPTFLSKLAIKLYSKFVGNAPNGYGSTGVQSRLDCYFREESGREPFNELIKPLIGVYFQ